MSRGSRVRIRGEGCEAGAARDGREAAESIAGWLDARSAAVSRPLAELKIKQTLDDRKLDQNLLRLEVSATGKGLIPELDRVLQVGSLCDAAGKSPFAAGSCAG